VFEAVESPPNGALLSGESADAVAAGGARRVVVPAREAVTTWMKREDETALAGLIRSREHLSRGADDVPSG
jgi:hypothetical protein